MPVSTEEGRCVSRYESNGRSLILMVGRRGPVMAGRGARGRHYACSQAVMSRLARDAVDMRIPRRGRSHVPST